MTEIIDYQQELKDIEADWNEEDSRIVEAARKMIEEERLNSEEEEKFKTIHLQRDKEEEYNYMARQSYLFYKNLPKLIRNYSGLYVWFEDGEVKDSDPDHLTLCSRAVRSDYFRASKINAIYVHQVPELN